MLTWFFKWCGVFFVALVIAVNVGKSVWMGLEALAILMLPPIIGAVVAFLAIVDAVYRMCRYFRARRKERGRDGLQ